MVAADETGLEYEEINFKDYLTKENIILLVVVILLTVLILAIGYYLGWTNAYIAAELEYKEMLSRCIII